MKKESWFFFNYKKYNPIYFQRCFKVAKSRWPNNEIVFFIKFYDENLSKQYNIKTVSSIDEFYKKSISSKKISRILIINDRENISRFINKELRVPIYRDIFGGIGGFKLVSPSSNEDDYKFWDSHIFNQLAKNHKYSGSGYVDYFPFFNIHRYFGQGDSNELGFRFDNYQALKNRDKNEKLIVILGNSGANDVFCTKEEMFSKKLENRLKLIYKKPFKVVNFSMPSAVIMDEINIFNSLVYHLKPDIVISHSGYNDLVNALMCDSHLLKTYDLIYSHQYENISGNIYNKEVNHTNRNYSVEQLEHAINVFIQKLIQLKELAELSGAEFIFGLQPYILSKKLLSFDEKNFLKTNNIQLEDVNFKILNKMYNILSETLPKYIESMIDFHKLFSQYGKEHTLFFDDIHATNKCNNILSFEYQNQVIKYLKKDKNLIKEEVIPNVNLRPDLTYIKQFQRVIIFGLGYGGKQIEHLLELYCKDIKRVFTDDTEQERKDFMRFNDLILDKNDIIIIAIYDKDIFEKIQKRLLIKKVSQSQIMWIGGSKLLVDIMIST